MYNIYLDLIYRIPLQCSNKYFICKMFADKLFINYPRNLFYSDFKRFKNNKHIIFIDRVSTIFRRFVKI